MEIKKLGEAGFDIAIKGLSLSYNVDISTAESFNKFVENVAFKLFDKELGHNKFLESIIVWLDITAPRYWWSEFDTYRVGITKQSESTMHTLMKQELRPDNFEKEAAPIDFLNLLNAFIMSGDFIQAKRLLPESFLQRRIVCTNYKTLRNMYQQRKNHRLPEWKHFCKSLKELCSYSLFLGGD